EYLAEKFPDRRLWPEATRERARARSLAAEMHAGFGALRTHCGMNIEASMPEIGRQVLAGQPEVASDLARIDAMWSGQIAAHGGPFLFGERFTIADAFYAPVCSRIRTYALPVSEASRRYAEHLLALPAMQQWTSQALAEHDFIEADEPYRRKP
ncbi:MAG TPA: glutathione S-transferase C-terminal domain-containing protein, partial [Albitalea sp.]